MAMAREPSSGSRPSPPNGSRHAGTAAGCAAARRQIPSPVHRRTCPARLPLRAAASSTPTAWSPNRCSRFDSIRFDPVRFERAHDFVLVLSSVLCLLDVSCRTTDPLVVDSDGHYFQRTRLSSCASSVTLARAARDNGLAAAALSFFSPFIVCRLVIVGRTTCPPPRADARQPAGDGDAGTQDVRRRPRSRDALALGDHRVLPLAVPGARCFFSVWYWSHFSSRPSGGWCPRFSGRPVTKPGRPPPPRAPGRAARRGARGRVSHSGGASPQARDPGVRRARGRDDDEGRGDAQGNEREASDSFSLVVASPASSRPMRSPFCHHTLTSRAARSSE